MLKDSWSTSCGGLATRPNKSLIVYKKTPAGGWKCFRGQEGIVSVVLHRLVTAWIGLLAALLAAGLQNTAPLAIAAQPQVRRPAVQSAFSRAEMEQFLLNASISTQREFLRQLRVTLDDGTRQHDALVMTADRNVQGDIYFNVAAYELDQLLGLNLVVPAVERTVNGERAVVEWWADDVAMMEIDRRRRNIQPPDADRWDKQTQAARVFDELVSNPWRSSNPATASWQELLITDDWGIWLIDHRTVFRVSRELETPSGLVRCDRTVWRKLRALNRDVLGQRLGKYLTPEQLDALEARRELLVKHFDREIAARGENVVLYDLPR